MTYKVVVVDDHLLIAKAISSIIEGFSGFEVLYEAENGKVLMDKFKVRVNIPDIVLMDISMPIMNGFETTQWLTDNYPDIVVMALSVQDDDDSLIKMIKAGAKGYLHKNVHPTELEVALKNLVDKGMYFPAWATSKVFMNLSKKDERKTINEIKLSERELEFLSYVCTELTYKEIADRMCCSPRTVEGYRDALFEKLEIKTRVGLAMYAVKSHIYEIK
ncbi:DNA-binding response regulator [Emticicia aquatilis]|uniref:DNA-binding response regulator n=1 Tax=Emticicia aquatilis TaxID=1537369 RepID=A0A916YGP4_9BACT|nr:response regulator transcription factor [Emticicia aquatilis]GGD44597.1 DNA-binding response regulator [Emticicia aquatilis]